MLYVLERRNINAYYLRRNERYLHTNSETAKVIFITDNSRAVMQLANTPIKQDYALKAELDKIIDLCKEEQYENSI